MPLFLISLLAIACGGESPTTDRVTEPITESSSPVRPPADLGPVPLPELSGLEPLLAARLEEQHAEAEKLLEVPETPAEERVRAFATLGKTFAAFGFLDAAEASLRNAEALAPEDPRWPHLRGVVAFERGELELAARHFERVLELEPDDLPALVHLGTTELELNRPGSASPRLERALELAPREAVVHDRLGRLAALEGDDAAAIEHYGRALELQPEASAVSYALGQAYRRVGEVDRARALLAAGGEREVTWHDPALFELGDWRNLVAFEVITARVLDPAGFDAEDTLNFTLTHLGDVSGSPEGIARYLAELERREGEIEPRVEGAFRYLLGGLLVLEGRDGDALEQLRGAVALAPDLVDARIKLGNALTRAGRMDEALEQYTQALARDPDHVAARLRRATLELARGRPNAALADLEKARELAPARRVEIQIALGAALTQAGRFQEALGEYRRALELDPASLEAQLGAARLEGHLGRHGAALDAYRAVLRLDPQNLEARLGEIAVLLLGERRADARERLEAGLRELGGPAFASGLARLLASAPEAELRDGERAVELARESFEERPAVENAQVLAMALAESGLLDEARELQRRALAELERAGGDGVELARRRLAAYASGNAWRALSPEELLPPRASDDSNP